MKYFKLTRNDGVYWITDNRTDLLIDLGMYKKDRQFRNCYNNKDLWIDFNGKKYRIDIIKSNVTIEIGFYQNGVKLSEEVENEKFPEKMEQTKDTIKAERIFTREPQNLEDVEFMFEIDSKFWECVKCTVSSWDITSTKLNRTATNYAVKAEFKRRSDIINYKELLEKFVEDSKKYSPQHNKIKYDLKPKTGNLLEIPILDLHLGKLGWHEEVGENYDSNIAEERFLKAISDLVSRNIESGFDRILFPVGSDFFNFDTIDGTTTKGTRQDTDVRWQKMFKKGCDMLIKAIDYMKQFAPVDIYYVPGNHDFQTSYYAVMFVCAWYKNCNEVSVDTSPQSRKYYKWGNCLIGMAHGDKERNRIANIMQVEVPEFWGDSIYREWHLGHYHSEITKEVGGIIIRHISSVTGTDAWHKTSGFVGAIKKAQSFLWNKDDGLLSIENSIIKR